MLLLRRSSNYARHIGARSLRNARHGNRYILLAFFSCLTLLLRALTGAGYQEQIPIAQNQSILRKIRIRSREGIEMGWERLGRPGLGIWHEVVDEVVKREQSLKGNWVHPALDAWKHRAEEFGKFHVEEHADVEMVEQHLMDEDEELFAASHTYHEALSAIPGGA